MPQITEEPGKELLEAKNEQQPKATLEDKLEQRFPTLADKMRCSRQVTAVGEALYYIGFWAEYAVLRFCRFARRMAQLAARQLLRLLTRAWSFVAGAIGFVFNEIAGPFVYFHQGWETTSALVHWTFKSKGLVAAVKLLFKRLGMGSGKFRHLVGRASMYILPLCALSVFLVTVHTVINYNYILAVQVNDQVVGYVDNEAVFDQAREAVRQRVESANFNTEDESRELVIVPTFTLAVEGEVLDENAMADAILYASSDEIQEATALYVDGELTAITAEGDKLRADLDELKAPYEDPDNPSQRVEFAKDVEVVDGIYFTDSISRYSKVKEKITGLEQAEVIYTVVEGDTPWNIARRNDLTIDQLYALNPQMTEKGYNMFIGDQLVIGQERQYLPVKVIHTVTYEEEVPFQTLTTESGDYEWGSIRTIVEGVPGLKEVTADITYENGIETERTILNETMLRDVVNAEVVKGTRLRDGSVAATATGTIMWPVPNYRYVSRWMSASHKGADICGPYGTAILAADSGVVTKAGWNATGRGYGYSILINHGNGMTTLYAHMSELYVSPGAYVSQGQVIAAMGSTGNSTGNHLHFEIRINGALVSARNYFPGM